MPVSTVRAAPIPAPEGARCAVHADERAMVSCARCGAFACAACAVDGVRCATCVTKEGIVDEPRASRWWLLGALPLLALGLVGLVTGGAAAVVVLRSRRTGALFPLGVYAAAALVAVVVRALFVT